MQIPRRKSEELRRKVQGPLHITEEGLRRLKEKLERLKFSLPGIIEETRRAAAFGDRSDNAEYKDAKSRLTRTHWQILTVEDQIRRAVIISAGKNISSTVRLGSIVTVQIGKSQKTFQILGAHETNPDLGRISFQSPLGAALMNRKKGDIVEIKTPSGSKEYTILEIK